MTEKPSPERLTREIVDGFAAEMRIATPDYLKLLRTFIERNEERVADLESAIRRQDWPEAHRMAHSIKGVALTLRIGWIAELATRLESALGASRGAELFEDIALLRSWVQRLRDESAELETDEC